MLVLYTNFVWPIWFLLSILLSLWRSIVDMKWDWLCWPFEIYFTGVDCNPYIQSANYGRVISIVFGYEIDKRMSGTLPLSIGNFQSMTEMRFYSSGLTGTIPSTVGALTSLQILRLIENDFTGIIPSSIGMLKSLEWLSISSNTRLGGPIPTSFSNLIKLKYLRINGNQLTGSIPKFFAGLTDLIRLTVDDNSLTGTIPSFIGNFQSLTMLHFSKNSLSGTIPSSMSLLTVLGDLWMNKNYLTMGNAITVPTSTFSEATLAGTLYLDYNCLAFYTVSPYPYRNVRVSNCRSVGKSNANCTVFTYIIAWWPMMMMVYCLIS